MFLRNYHRAFGLPLIITNGANTYGKRQLEEKIIPLTIKRIYDEGKRFLSTKLLQKGCGFM